eukprot:COSAG05_NODE_355_length_10856_cov_7.197174_11_plen_87_part_00
MFNVNGQWSILNAQYTVILNAQYTVNLNAQCSMLMLNAQCSMLNAQCSMSNVNDMLMFNVHVHSFNVQPPPMHDHAQQAYVVLSSV